ncbi:MAG TPA: pseudouridine synthase [Thermoproteales archaeon]|nr:pseudouridine synthase [Thermoproteales archaeon]
MSKVLESPTRFDLEQIKAQLVYQYGRNVVRILDFGEIKVQKSGKTGRLKHVYLNGKMIFSLRATDGFLIFSLEGARLFLKAVPPPSSRVVVMPEVAPFIARGRNLFSKHVVRADENIRPSEEVIVVTPEDNLVAIGRALLAGWEMVKARRGIAVKIRKGVKG